MTVQPTYPGVYLVETTDVPHVVTPATTNLTAFVGDFAKGPTDRAVLVGSWAEFTALYGGLMATSLASYGVYQFFQNGGIGAWIVRIAPPDPLPDGSKATAATTATATVGSLAFSARGPGKWASGLALDLTVSTVKLGTTTRTLATLTVSEPSPSTTVLETLSNLPADSAAVLAGAVNTQSAYVTVATPASSAAAPTSGTASLGTAADAVWDEAAFVAAVTAQVSDGGLLDGIAPQVFNLLCIPDATLVAGSATAVYQEAVRFCDKRQALVLVDPPPPSAPVDPLWADPGVTPVGNVGADPANVTALLTTWGENLLTPDFAAGAVYYPWLRIADPANADLPRFVPPSGSVAGVYATTDVTRAVWKAPAGGNAALVGVDALADQTVADAVNGTLNVAGVNCLRTFPVYGTVVWGARTLAGSDLGGSPWKYVPVRRLADFIEQSLRQSLRWAVFEPNSEPLWASIAFEVGTFMSSLFAAGAFSGATAATSYSVVCDASTTSPIDMLNGIVNVRVGFQPVYPAEFVMLNIQLDAGPAAG